MTTVNNKEGRTMTLTPIIEASRSFYTPTKDYPQPWSSWIENIHDMSPSCGLVIGNDGIVYLLEVS